MVHIYALPLEVPRDVFDVNSPVVKFEGRNSTVSYSLDMFAENSSHLMLFVILAKAPLAEMALIHFHPSGSVRLSLRTTSARHLRCSEMKVVLHDYHDLLERFIFVNVEPLNLRAVPIPVLI